MIELIGKPDNFVQVICIKPDLEHPTILRTKQDLLALRHRWRWVESYWNLIPDAGADDLLSVYLCNGTQEPSWYIGLVDALGFSAFANSDVAAQIGGTNAWAELTGYSEGTRQTCVFGTPSGRSVDNSLSLPTFTISASATVHGAFLASSSVKGGTGGTLYGEGPFALDQPMYSGDVVTVIVTAKML